jgi:hypothetical protein
MQRFVCQRAKWQLLSTDTTPGLPIMVQNYPQYCEGCYKSFAVFEKFCVLIPWAGIAQSVQRLSTGWKVRGPYPGGGEIFPTRPDRS